MPRQELDRIGKYEIVDLIGEGAMGVVYRARDPILNRSVAIKVMTEALAREPELRDRFLREAQAAGSLQHPNVITVYDFGEVDGHLYIAMELIEGVDLEQLLARHEPLPLQRKLEIAIDVLTGLAYAHKHGIVHRDIKPANIRVAEDGRAKIMDFGIAHLSSSSMTQTGMMLGTPNYMAPEQVTGGKTTPATDIFAFGAVMYELLTNSKPFYGPTLHNILYRIVSDEPTPLLELLPGLPPSLGAIVTRALAKDPERRYQSALDMANDITAIRAELSDGPHVNTLSLRKSTAAFITPDRAKRVPAWLRSPMWLAAAAVVLVIGAGGWFLRGASSDRPTSTAGASTDSVLHYTPPAPVAPVTAVPPSAPPARRDTAVPAPPRASASAPPASQREESRVRALRTAAMRMRERAAAAGATPSQLAAGDEHLHTANDLILSGDLAQASTHLSSATGAWEEAERAARLAAAQASSTAAAPSSPPVAPPVTKVAASSTAASPPAAPPPAPPPPPPAPAPAPVVVNPSVAIEAVIADYARAIGSRDIAEVRRANPGLTDTQQKGFEDFFQSVKSLRANFSVASLDVSGTTAEAHVTGAYEYSSGSKVDRQPVTFVATLRLTGGAWKLTSVR